MRKFFIITNHLKDPELVQTNRIRSWLEEKGCSCVVCDSASSDADPLRKGKSYRYTDPDKVPPGTECVLVLGGDGTLLQAAGDLIETSLPLLGINMGKLGYLAEIEMPQAHSALEKVIRDECAVEKRMMLEGKICRGSEELISELALNDIVISRRGRFRVVDFAIYVDGAFLCSFQADGIIVSTPTGSTGYSLSAGGPIVAPEASLMLLTAVAPHTISSRPVILPDHVEIEVELGRANTYPGDGAQVNFDGNTVSGLEPGERVLIRKARNCAKLVRVNHTSFVEILRSKMN